MIIKASPEKGYMPKGGLLEVAQYTEETLTGKKLTNNTTDNKHHTNEANNYHTDHFYSLILPISKRYRASHSLHLH